MKLNDKISQVDIAQKIGWALDAIEKSESILASARHWTVNEVEEEAGRADNHLDSAASYLQDCVVDEEDE